MNGFERAIFWRSNFFSVINKELFTHHFIFFTDIMYFLNALLYEISRLFLISYYIIYYTCCPNNK